MALAEYLFLYDPTDPSHCVYYNTSLLDTPGSGVSPTVIQQLRALVSHGSTLGSFLHICDPELAFQWIRKAASYTEAGIDALPTAAQQDQAVVECWTAFANYWRALNVSPYAWDPLRDAMKQAWATRLVQGSWRQQAYDFWTHHGVRASDVNNVVIGRGQNYQTGCGDNYDGTRPTTCHAPSGQEHRIWMRGDGTFGGGYNPPPASVPQYFSFTHCDPVPGQRGARPLPAVMTGPPASWRCTSGKVDGSNLLILASMHDYFMLLKPVIDHLAQRNPLEIVNEANADVIKRNLDTARRFGVDVAKLPGLAGVQQAQAKAQGLNTTVRDVLNGVETVGTTVGAVVPGVGTVVGGAIAGVTAIVGVVADALSGGKDHVRDEYGMDLPGAANLEIVPYTPQYQVRTQRLAVVQPLMPAAPAGIPVTPVPVLTFGGSLVVPGSPAAQGPAGASPNGSSNGSDGGSSSGSTALVVGVAVTATAAVIGAALYAGRSKRTSSKRPTHRNPSSQRKRARS